VDSDRDSHAPKIRVLMVGAIGLYRESLACFLEEHGDIRVLDAVRDHPAALTRAGELKPDVVLLDMAVSGTPAAVRAMARAAPEAKVIVLVVAEREDEAVTCDQAGVVGYVSPDDCLCDLVATIHSAARGETRCSPRIATALTRRLSRLTMERGTRPPSAGLTAREAEILALIDQGFSNKEIAERLVIEVPTVKNHVHNILTKMRVHRRGQAAARMRAGSSALKSPLQP
jgi:two-component system nitrate/nitrite response regulator NarL